MDLRNLPIEIPQNSAVSTKDVFISSGYHCFVEAVSQHGREKSQMQTNPAECRSVLKDVGVFPLLPPVMVSILQLDVCELTPVLTQSPIDINREVCTG